MTFALVASVIAAAGSVYAAHAQQLPRTGQRQKERSPRAQQLRLHDWTLCSYCRRDWSPQQHDTCPGCGAPPSRATA